MKRTIEAVAGDGKAMTLAEMQEFMRAATSMFDHGDRPPPPDAGGAEGPCQIRAHLGWRGGVRSITATER